MAHWRRRWDIIYQSYRVIDFNIPGYTKDNQNTQENLPRKVLRGSIANIFTWNPRVSVKY